MTKIASYNVNGLRDVNKFERVMTLCKADILCLQETHWDADFVKKLKGHWSGVFFSSFCSNRARGVSILVNNQFAGDATLINNDNDGRWVKIEFKRDNRTFRLLNIHAPNIEKDRVIFFQNMIHIVRDCDIIMGDFNVKMSRLDYRGLSAFKHDSSRTVLMKMMDNQDFCDLWRTLNPTKREFSRIQVVLNKVKQSRVDLCLVKKQEINMYNAMNHELNYLSDHAIVYVGIEGKRRGKGGGVWHLNANLLSKKEYVDCINKLIAFECSQPDFQRNISDGWDKLKSKIKFKSIQFAKRLNFSRKEKERELRCEWVRLNGEPVVDNVKLIGIQNEINEMERIKCEGAIVRSRAQYAIEGEKSTQFFLNLEKRRQEKCYLNYIRNKEGKIVNDFVKIVGCVQDYYEALYKSEGSDEVATKNVLGVIKSKLGVSDKLICEQDIMTTDIDKAIDQLSVNKSPGSDGLTTNFYKVFKKILSPILLQVFDDIEKKRVMPDSMVMGLISLVFKKGDREDLANYRPITLMNVDYKILTKIFANRVKMVIDKIVAPTQAYSVPERDICDTICTIRDVVEYMKETEQGGIVLALDFNKAFDRVEHSFMFKVIRKFGFGERFLKWLSLLYSGARGKVKVNGVLTDAFKIERSVRQGCPLSALLYAMVAEPMAQLIKFNSQIKGIELPGSGLCTIQQFADDTTITVKSMTCVENVIDMINLYGRASGAKINLKKSEIMFINMDEPQQLELQFKIQRRYMKILGVDIGKDYEEARDNTWTEIINRMQKCLTYWKFRDLKIKGKVIVVNSLIMSKVNYVLAVLDLPKWVSNNINKMVTRFIWGAEKGKIARKTLIGKFNEGGQQLVDITTKMKAYRIKIIRKYLYDPNQYGWKNIMGYYLNKVLNIKDFTLLMELKWPMSEALPNFYREVLSVHAEFLEYVQYECADLKMIKEMPIFLTRKIKSNDKSLYHKKMMRAGFVQIKDLMYEFMPGFLPPKAIFECVNNVDDGVKIGNIENICKLIQNNMPQRWRESIETEVVLGSENKIPDLYMKHGGGWKMFNLVKTKDIYDLLLQNVKQPPASLNFWCKTFPSLQREQIWGRWKVKGNSIDAEDTDYKIRHNKIYTNVVLHQFDRGVGRACDICEAEPETLLHLFCECVELKVFFDKLKKVLQGKLYLVWSVNDVWEFFLLFGEWRESRVENATLCRFLLSQARRAIKIRRDLAHFEHKKLQIWPIFKANVITHIKYSILHNAAGSNRPPLTNNSLVSLGEGGDLVWNWG